MLYIYIHIYIYIYIYTCVIVKTICPPSYHHNGFVATWQLMHLVYERVHHVCTSCSLVHESPQSHCGDVRRAQCSHDYTYIASSLLL